MCSHVASNCYKSHFNFLSVILRSNKLISSTRAVLFLPMRKCEVCCKLVFGSHLVSVSTDAMPKQTVIKDRDDAAAVLRKIAQFEAHGAILPADAHTLRTQVQDSSSGQWPAVEKRLQQLACGWNPYQRLRSDAAKSASKNSEGKPSVQKKQDFYELLQLEDRKNAMPEDIKRQFRTLALRLHPDKQQQQYAAQALGNDAIADRKESGDGNEDALLRDSTKFARLRLAYETLSNPARRAEYDATLAEQCIKAEGAEVASPERGVRVANQMQLEANTDFASLEWMARVKHKMDVMDRIADWAKMLGINATEIRFETGEPCLGCGCGKIVSMDRDLECYGSPRRRVYVCLLHKYIHACDEVCTSHEADTALDRKVCPIRAHWLVQNWIFDQLQAQSLTDLVALGNAENSKVKQEHDVKDTDENVTDASSAAEAKPIQAIGQNQQETEHFQSPQLNPIATGSNLECMLEATEIHLGGTLTKFCVSTASDCRRENCAARFQFLEQGIYACRRHGTPHICTFEQCDTKELQAGRYICWVSGCMYGWQREEVGTGVRTRQLIYTNMHGESSSIEMEVPTLLPLGKMASYLLIEKSHRSAASFSPPPPAEKTWHGIKRSHEDDTGYDSDSISPRRMIKRQKSDTETSPTRARIRRCIATKVQQSETMTFFVYMKLPPAVANLPKVSLELHNSDDEDSDDDNGSSKMAPIRDRTSGLLPIRVNAKHTVNYIKYWMEELTDQQISIWDQQIFWGDTLIGEEDNVMPLEEHGIVDGCMLELRLHDDCALLVSTWNNNRVSAGMTEYNTVQISKEAEEDLEDHQEELTNVIAVEEEAFKRRRLERKREKLQHTGALNHVEVIEYNGSLPRLVGMIPMNSRLKQLGHRQNSTASDVQLIKEEERTVMNEDQALKRIANDAKPVK